MSTSGNGKIHSAWWLVSSHNGMQLPSNTSQSPWNDTLIIRTGRLSTKNGKSKRFADSVFRQSSMIKL